MHICDYAIVRLCCATVPAKGEGSVAAWSMDWPHLQCMCVCTFPRIPPTYHPPSTTHLPRTTYHPPTTHLPPTTYHLPPTYHQPPTTSHHPPLLLITRSVTATVTSNNIQWGLLHASRFMHHLPTTTHYSHTTPAHQQLQSQQTGDGFTLTHTFELRIRGCCWLLAAYPPCPSRRAAPWPL
jgi:hypothetical protein